jgi:predicted nuclease of predicted toxin-antitoxin system
MRFLADEDFPLASVKRLRVAGHDVAAIGAECPGVSDREALARAVREDRIILTFDRDFGELLFRSRLPAPLGVVYFRLKPASPLEPAEYLMRLLALPDASLLQQFTTVDARHVRQRRLGMRSA